MVGYMCGRLHVWSATRVVGYTSGRYMCGRVHVWLDMCCWLHNLQYSSPKTKITGYYLWVEFSRREQHSTRRVDTEQREHGGSPHSH